MGDYIRDRPLVDEELGLKNTFNLTIILNLKVILSQEKERYEKEGTEGNLSL